ncbi:tetratricopeptide repeat protein [Sandaracinus amylolyticus]|uniref:PEGA domain-containing protein n=1 Tax=Sandaracinus amylolyticus TaxID=927083 RepID=A0A0F6SDN6_9BACT|nr:tetratricopeptide repeat protein [Sandaracinus amylolyticus]AKF03759.1 hypothetical protein DB32_000908 [Sandaracinus amylolyticus]
MSRALVLLVLGMIGVGSSRAHAQFDEITAPDDATIARARELFELGHGAMDQGRFELAIEHLSASLAIAARPATAFDLAIALRGAGHPTHAVEILDGLLAGSYGALRSAQRDEVVRLRAATAADVAHVRIRVAPQGEIELRIDGLRVDDIAPGAWIERALDPGRHAITASAPARVPAERVVVLERGGHAEIELELAPELRPGTLAVEGTAPELQVEIVGIARGRGRVAAEIPPGAYVVRATGAGGASETRIEVPSGRTVRLRVSGRDVSIAEEPWFWVALVGGVVALGGAAAATAVALDPPLTDAIADPVFGVTVALTGP